MPEVSIVVPVFNVESYIEECISSLLAQYFEDIEIIIVDDGSTDRSALLCDKMAGLDSRIRVLHQENLGLSAARNAGLRIAQGRYVVCVDGDDIVSPCYVGALHHAATQSGCTMAAVRHGTPFFDGEIPKLSNCRGSKCSFRVLSEKDYQEELLYQASGNGAPWRMCEAEVARRHLFPEGYLYEDLATTYKLVHDCGSVAVLDSTSLYGYRQRAGSIMRRSGTESNVRSCLEITNALVRDIAAWYPSLSAAVSSRCFSVARAVYAGLPPQAYEEKRAVWHLLRQHARTVIKDGKARKRERVAAATSMIGEKPFMLFCVLYRLYKRV